MADVTWDAAPSSVQWDDGIQWDDEGSKDPSYLSRVVKEGLPAVANTGVDILSSIPSGLSAAIEGVGHGLQTGAHALFGNDISDRDAMGAAASTFNKNMETMKGRMPRFRGKGVDEAQSTLMDMVEKPIGYIGDITGDPAPFATGDAEGAIPESPAGRTLGEAASNFAPLPGAKGIQRGVSKIPHVGSEWKAAREVQMQQAEKVLAEKMAGDTEATSWDKWADESRQMEANLRELDNLMVKYPKDLQSPQLGGGGKVAHPEDTVSREKGKYANQMAFDEDMRKAGYGYEKYNLQQEEAQRLSPAKFYTPDRMQTESTPRLTEAEQIAQETSNAMGKTRPNKEVLDKTPFDDPEALGGQSKNSGFQVITQADDPNPFPSGMKYAVSHDTEGTLVHFETAKEAHDWMQQEIEFRKSLGGQSHDILGYNQQLFDLQKVHDRTELPAKDANGFAIEQPQVGMRDQLEAVVDHSNQEPYKEVARLLLADKKFNPRFEVGDPLNLDTQRHGAYVPTDYKVYIKPDWLGDERILIHEAVHARTHAAIEGALRETPGFEHLKPAVRRLQDLYINFSDNWTKTNPFVPGSDKPINKPYGITNIHEFIAEAFSNPQFQALLARTEVPKGLKSNFFRNYWDMFVDRLGQILGFNRSHNNYLSETIKAGADIMHGSDEGTRRLFDTNDSLTDSFGGYSRRDFEQDLKAKGLNLPRSVVKSMWEKQQPEAPKPTSGHPEEATIRTVQKVPGLEKIQQQYADKRPFEEIVKLSASVPDTSFAHANVISKVIQGKFTAVDHPLLSWVSSQIHWLKNGSLTAANQKLHGKDRRNPEPGTYNYVWRQLTGVEREEVNRVGWKLNNEATIADTTRLQAEARKQLGKELSQKQVKAYTDRVRINKEVLADVNAILVENGKEPIPELPNYWSPNTFNGPFLLKFIDKKTGDTVKIHSAYLKPNIEKLSKQFPDYKLETIEKGLKGNVDFDQIDWILRQLNKEMRDPAARAISEGLRRQGFSRHGLKRDMVEGGLGSSPDRKGLREYEETSERYIRQAYDYIANRKTDSLYNQVLDEKKLDGSPHAKGYSLEAIDTARGGANEAMEGLSRGLGELFRGAVTISSLGRINLPQRALRDVIRYSNKTMTSLLLAFGNVTNITAQLFQHTYAYPKMLAIAADNGLNTAQMAAATFRAAAKAHIELTKWETSKDVQKLREIGTLDPTFKYDWSTYASDSDPRWSKSMREHLTGMSILAKLESDAVRRPAALLFLNMLREVGYDKIAKSKDEIFYVAKEMTDHYMVSTKWYEKPHMFSRSGIVGTATSPLQSFTTTWAGMFREYTKMSAAGLLEGSVAKQMPLASFMAINLLTAGTLGLIGVKEWDAVATWLNKNYGFNVPTGTEFLMSKVKSSVGRFGLLSSATGYNIGATFNAPTVTGSFAPGIQGLANAGNLVKQVGREYLAPTGLTSAPTMVEKRDALKGVTPRFSPIPGFNWGDIEKKYTPQGLPYQDTSGNAGPVTRDAADWRARRLGTYTLKEATEKTENFIRERDANQRSTRLSKQVDRMVNALLEDPSTAMQKMEPMIRSLEQDRFAGADIKNGLRRELLNKIVESDVRAMKGTASSRKAFIAQLLEKLR